MLWTFFVLLLASAATVAQTTTPARSPVPATTAAPRVAVINSYAFGDEKSGIVKYVNAVKSVNTEFAPLQTEINTMSTRLEALAKEIDTLRGQVGKVPVDERALQTKIDTASQLQRDIKFKQEDGKARFDRRLQTVLGPVLEDVGKALREYAKQKSYAVIFDIAKDEAGLLIVIGDESVDVTRDFITFYNARPATPTPKTE
jgi:Skp family chaperone for outer membrane proteins